MRSIEAGAMARCRFLTQYTMLQIQSLRSTGCAVACSGMTSRVLVIVTQPYQCGSLVTWCPFHSSSLASHCSSSELPQGIVCNELQSSVAPKCNMANLLLRFQCSDMDCAAGSLLATRDRCSCKAICQRYMGFEYSDMWLKDVAQQGILLVAHNAIYRGWLRACTM